MDVVLFVVIALIAVASAAFMLLTENAVHSALFLIVNFACVAFFYLMLDAPFLAMIQIAVYAGAIMVLFLFVIMLLGAEKLSQPAPRFRWMTPVAIFLSVIFLLTSYWGIKSGQIDLQAPSGGAPVLRVVHAATDVGAVDVYLNGELAAENVVFGEATEFMALSGGDTLLRLNQMGTDTAVFESPVVVEANPEQNTNAYSAVVYGARPALAPSLAVVAEDLETTENRAGRLTVFNAYVESPTISLVDFGSDFAEDDTVVRVDALEQGVASEALTLEEDTPLRAWAVTLPDNTTILRRLNNPEVYNVERNTSQLIVVAGERQFDGTVRAAALALVNRAEPSFGGPQAIGEQLFTRYLLPFQMVAVLLLVAMIGAIVLTHKETEKKERKERRRVSRPLVNVLSAQTGHDVLETGANGGAAGELESPEEQPEVAGG